MQKLSKSGCIGRARDSWWILEFSICVLNLNLPTLKIDTYDLKISIGRLYKSKPLIFKIFVTPKLNL